MVDKFGLKIFKKYNIQAVSFETAKTDGKALYYRSQGCHSQGKVSGKWNFFQVREKAGNIFCWWSGKFRKDLESQGKVRELENKWLWQAVFRKIIYSVQEGKGCSLR